MDVIVICDTQILDLEDGSTRVKTVTTVGRVLGARCYESQGKYFSWLFDSGKRSAT